MAQTKGHARASVVEMDSMIDSPQESAPQGLSSPPDSNNAHKLDGSDSELSDLDSDDEELPELHPSSYSDNGTVPIFTPSMEEFKNFERFMKRINSYGMRTGIVKVIPPREWVDALPPLDQAIKTIKVKDPISQEIMGSAGTYRQANIQHMRSYNLPQWRHLCDQSAHQPPAKRGERRANQDKDGRSGARGKSAATTRNGRNKRAAKAGIKTEELAETRAGLDRLPTPVSPGHQADDGEEAPALHVKDEDESPVKPRGGRQAKAAATATSVSSRRKYNRREAATKIDEEAFVDFDYKLDIEEYTKERCEDLERAYWKTLTYAPPLYGADMPGTLFDEVKTKIWNLNNLENILDVLGSKIPGVNTAYLYLGMWKATFAWHLEDVDLYSINYLHFGAPKQWYSISQGDARRFEQAMKNIWPVDAKTCDQFLRHKTFLISPSTLAEKYNIKVNKVVHRPGEFVITFPYGYHSGYNLGYNCAEAVNFGMKSWLDYGRIAKKCDCAHSQDSVFIDVRQIDRKLNGELTEDEFSEAGDDQYLSEVEDGPTDLPTPPGSSRESRRKSQNKRKRPMKDKHDNVNAKRLRVRIKPAAKEPCALCPHECPLEPLLPTADGRKVHRKCAEYIPETSIAVIDSVETVTDMDNINKARLDLKCVHCRSKKGACFQCSYGKCSRAYHATCAAAAGVFVESGETPVWGEDGTEYKMDGHEFSCRFHRAKRDKKLNSDDLGEDSRIRSVGKDLAPGDTCQFQYLNDKPDYFAGVVVENRKSEETLLVEILPKGSRVEVEYKYLRLPDPSDQRLAKPSTNAVPLPKQSLTTTKRQVDDLPRDGDHFVQGCTWKEFNRLDVKQNAVQQKVNFSDPNQIWYYLGKTSTEARAQYTEDPVKQQNNPKAYFLDTITKPPQRHPSRTSITASHPQSRAPSQTAINQARVLADPLKYPKPYNYKPRPGEIEPSYRVDPAALKSQQAFLAQSTPSQSTSHRYGSDHSFDDGEVRWRPADDRMCSPYSRLSSAQLSASPASPTPKTHSVDAGAIAPALTAHSHSDGLSVGSNNSRPASNTARFGKTPNLYAKYPYLQKEHNRSPIDYKSPYSSRGGFMNGYEGDLKEYLRQNPDALFKLGRQAQAASQAPGLSLPHWNPPKKEYPPILPPPRKSYTRPAEQVAARNLPTQQTLPTHKVTKLLSSSDWEKKNTSQLHPAIRQEYGSMFHQSYQPAKKSAPSTYQSLNKPSKVHQAPAGHAHYPAIVSAESTPRGLAASDHGLAGDCVDYAKSTSPLEICALPAPVAEHASCAPPLPTLVARAYQTPRSGHEQEEKDSLYTHQVYYDRAASAPKSIMSQGPNDSLDQALPPMQVLERSGSEWQPPTTGDFPDVPADSTSLVEHMMLNLRRATARGPQALRLDSDAPLDHET